MVLHRDDFARLRREQPQIDQFLLDAAAPRSAPPFRCSRRPRCTYRPNAGCCAACPRSPRSGPPANLCHLSQQDIAQLAGCRPVRDANRVLASAQADGLVSLGRGRVEVVDPRRARGGHPPLTRPADPPDRVWLARAFVAILASLRFVAALTLTTRESGPSVASPTVGECHPGDVRSSAGPDDLFTKPHLKPSRSPSNVNACRSNDTRAPASWWSPSGSRH